MGCSRTGLFEPVAQSTDAPASCDDLVLWLDARTGVEADSSGAVSAWRDQSGLHHDATQPDASARPTLGSPLAGHATVRFDGVGSYLTLPAGFEDFSCGLTAFIVVAPQATTYLHASRFFDLSAQYGSLSDSILFNRFGAGDELLYQTYVGPMIGVYADAPHTVIDGPWQLFEVVASAEGATLYKNAVSLVTATVALPTPVMRDSNLIAKSNRSGPVDSFLEGAIAELRIYARTLDDTRRQDVESTLRSTWQLW
jgi:hypothetical protein